jgi:hypothetical protein
MAAAADPAKTATFRDRFATVAFNAWAGRLRDQLEPCRFVGDRHLHSEKDGFKQPAFVRRADPDQCGGVKPSNS